MLTNIKSRYNNLKIEKPAVIDAAKFAWTVAVTVSTTLVLVEAAQKLDNKIEAAAE